MMLTYLYKRKRFIGLKHTISSHLLCIPTVILPYIRTFPTHWSHFTLYSLREVATRLNEIKLSGRSVVIVFFAERF